ncbi:protein RALF-like 34 [Typha latifolia]|uniref:protein RALF-like 34 n=1 Tax=Typha latifolia TaxID=4733 RepID=UPI003C2CAED8
MARPHLSALLLLLFLLCSSCNVALLANAQVDETMEMMEWPKYPFGSEPNEEEELIDGLGDVISDENNRRALSWYRRHYFISYSALSANRVPCPPRSGRSYYTHNCYKAKGPVHPYSRGCSAITRCRR